MSDSVLVEHIDRHSKARPLYLAAIDGGNGIAQHETGADIRAARHRGELDIGFRLLDFFRRNGQPIDSNWSNISAWHKRMSQRPSASA